MASNLCACFRERQQKRLAEGHDPSLILLLLWGEALGFEKMGYFWVHSSSPCYSYCSSDDRSCHEAVRYCKVHSFPLDPEPNFYFKWSKAKSTVPSKTYSGCSKHRGIGQNLKVISKLDEGGVARNQHSWVIPSTTEGGNWDWQWS